MIHIKRLFVLSAMFICLCFGVKAQNWTWTGETPAAESWYLYHPDWGFIHADASNSKPAKIDDATLFTITGTGTTATKLAYKVGSTTYYLNNNSGTMEINTTGSNLYVRIGNATDGYYITTYSATSLNTSGSGNNRYLNVWDGGAGWSRGNGGNKTQWRFISQGQVTAYNNYVAAHIALTPCAGENLISLDLKNRIANALAAATNYGNASANTATLTSLKTEFDNYIVSLPSATKGSPKDVTGIVVNPGFEASTWNQGWTVEGFGDHANDGKFGGSHAPEMWSPDLVSGSIKQTISNLPNGVYKLRATATGGFDGTTKLYAKTTAEERNISIPGIDGDPAQTPEVMFRIIPGDNNQVEIGFVRDNCRWWTAVDDFSLEYLGETPAFTYEMGTRLDGSYLSKPAYTSTPADGVDPDHANDGLLVITWPNENTDDPWATFKLTDGAKAIVTADGVNKEVDLLTSFRSTTYSFGFGLYIPDFDENKTYNVTIPANSIGFGTVNSDAYGGEFVKVMNEEFSINAKQSPIRDGKYFIVVKNTGEHVSRGGHYGTQSVLDYMGVPVLVQTAGLTVFKFIDNNAFLGTSYENDGLLYTDCQDDRMRRYQLMADDEHPDEYRFYTAARDVYLAHGVDNENGLDVMMEKAIGDCYQFEPLTEEGYAEHLKGISDDEAKRVAERAGLAVSSREEYNQLISALEDKGVTQVWPISDDQIVASEEYHDARNDAMAMGFGRNDPPKDLITSEQGRLTLTLDEGLYCVGLNAFQQAMELDKLQANLGFRGLVYYYAKVGDVMSKDQLKSITETTGSIPTTEEEAKTALVGDNYYSRIVFYVPENGTSVEFGVQNPQRLGNGIDGTAGSWAAFQNLVVEKFADISEVKDVANLTVNANGFGTFVAPFATKMPEGVIAYTSETVEGDHVVMTPIAKGTLENGDKVTEYLPANTPVIVKNTTDAKITVDYEGYNVEGTKGVTVGLLTGYNNDLSTNFIEEGSYILQIQNGEYKFYKVTVNNRVCKKNRCYLTKPANVNSAALRIVFEEDLIATDVDVIEPLDEVTNATYYSVSGARLNAPQQGLNIVKLGNGKTKKIFVK